MLTMMNLADPVLELLDPTPNVHAMFIHFDITFFWAKLASRCVVRWSKRMYSCAGICSYEGRGGLCDIAISEPLLKLRPRKDLVETLLHEMIHAYLFVTKQDQDRDGHGPNFQAHMHRINRAAGLNISIYHDFHDEVELYQTHWWRCNGPCQLHRPYFGIVRRSCNRAPGPSDYWWNSHLKNCGGTFIKIKEPDKPEKKSKKPNAVKTNADITKYINNNNKDTNNKNIQNDKMTETILKDSMNVSVTPKVGIRSNINSTFIITKNMVIFKPEVPTSKPAVFSGPELTIATELASKGVRKRTSSAGVLETVRNVWANEQITTNNNNQIFKHNNIRNLSTPNKNNVNPSTKSPPPKYKKIDDYFKTAATSVLKDVYGQDFNITQSKGDQKLKVTPQNNNFVDCPVCNIKIDPIQINMHLDECLNKSVIEKLSNEYNPAVKDKSKIDGDQMKRNRLNEITSDPVFESRFIYEAVLENDRVNKNIKRSRSVSNTQGINMTDQTHVKETGCKRTRTSLNQGDFKTIEQPKDTNNYKKPMTANIVDNFVINNNLSVSSKSDETEASSSKSDSAFETACPCCGDKLNTPVDDHLDECLSFLENNTTLPKEGASTSNFNGIIVIEDDEDEFDESQKFNDTGTKFPCPCCLKMIEESNMNSHLDTCLS